MKMAFKLTVGVVAGVAALGVTGLLVWRRRSSEVAAPEAAPSTVLMLPAVPNAPAAPTPVDLSRMDVAERQVFEASVQMLRAKYPAMTTAEVEAAALAVTRDPTAASQVAAGLRSSVVVPFQPVAPVPKVLPGLAGVVANVASQVVAVAPPTPKVLSGLSGMVANVASQVAAVVGRAEPPPAPPPPVVPLAKPPAPPPPAVSGIKLLADPGNLLTAAVGRAEPPPAKVQAGVTPPVKVVNKPGGLWAGNQLI